MALEVDLSSLEDYSAHLALRPLIDVFRQKRKIVVIAGAGISASAGIPTFENLQVDGKNVKGKDVFSLNSYTNDAGRDLLHKTICEIHQLIMAATPTQFHLLIASLAEEGRLHRLYTQNIDGLDTQLETLKTQIPLPLRKPWPKTIQMHGNLRTVQCIGYATHKTEFNPENFKAGAEPWCSICEDEMKASRKRGRQVCMTKPRVLLYDEPDFEDSESIAKVIQHDLKAKPDAVIVVGTALKVKMAKSLVRDMCTVVKQARGCTAWINLRPPPNDLKCFDIAIKGNCEDIAMHVSSWWGNGCPNILSKSGIQYLQEKYNLFIATSSEELLSRALLENESNPNFLEQKFLQLADEQNVSAPKDTAEPAEPGFTAVNHNIDIAQPPDRHPLPAAAPTSKTATLEASSSASLVVPERKILPARSRTPKNQSPSRSMSRTAAFTRGNPVRVFAMDQSQPATPWSVVNTLPDLPECWRSDCRKRLQKVIVEVSDHIPKSSSVITKISLSGYREPYLGKSLWRLAKGQWLNDEILNAYFELLKKLLPTNQRIENTTIIPHILRPNTTPYDLQKLIDTGSYTLYVPIHNINHWSFSVIASKKKGDAVRWTHLCSNNGQAPDIFRRWLKAVFSREEVVEVPIPGYPKQGNGADCGVFVLLGIRLLSSNQGYLSQEQSNAIIPSLRERILAELLASSLDPSASEHENFIKKEAMADILQLEEQDSSDGDIIMIDDPRETKGAHAAESGLFVEDSDESPSERLDLSEQEEEAIGLKLSLSGRRRPEQLAQDFGDEESMLKTLMEAVRLERYTQKEGGYPRIGNMKLADLWIVASTEKRNLKQRYLHHEFSRKFWEEMHGMDRNPHQRGPIPKTVASRMMESLEVTPQTNWKYVLQWARRALVWIELADIFRDSLEHPSVALCAVAGATNTLEKLTLTSREKYINTIRLRVQEQDSEIVARLRSATPLYLALVGGNLSTGVLPIESNETSLSFEDKVKYLAD
ncbi:hypothetical protein VE00_09010 [Pseudogymnoascus sp. WSF 3629]|nr:hypothetical protein VE00_09010 [Pseudogymnoascus sp. WSF 3629]